MHLPIVLLLLLILLPTPHLLAQPSATKVLLLESFLDAQTESSCYKVKDDLDSYHNEITKILNQYSGAEVTLQRETDLDIFKISSLFYKNRPIQPSLINNNHFSYIIGVDTIARHGNIIIYNTENNSYSNTKLNSKIPWPKCAVDPNDLIKSFNKLLIENIPARKSTYQETISTLSQVPTKETEVKRTTKLNVAIFPFRTRGANYDEKLIKHIEDGLSHIDGINISHSFYNLNHDNEYKILTLPEGIGTNIYSDITKRKLSNANFELIYKFMINKSIDVGLFLTNDISDKKDTFDALFIDMKNNLFVSVDTWTDMFTSYEGKNEINRLLKSGFEQYRNGKTQTLIANETFEELTSRTITKNYAPKQQASVSKNYDAIAVIIGGKNYSKNNPDVPNVDYALNDAEQIYQYVVDVLGYREGNIIYLKDPTQSDFTATFGSPMSPKGKLYDWVRPNMSDVFVYYSGHGAPSLSDGQGYLLPVNADPQRIELTGFPLETLYKNLAQVPARSMTVVIDACFSGSSQSGTVVKNASSIALRQVQATNLLPKGAVLTAAGSGEVASWDASEKLGLFTKHFLDGVYGKADGTRFGNGDGKVTLGELKNYLESEVTYLARRQYSREQHPQISGTSSRLMSDLSFGH